MLYTQRSKCAGCDQRNASIYCADTDNMYCYDCYTEKAIQDECFCDDDRGVTCHIHIEY